ncbi:cytochrome P450 [Xylogone sp. PMI_703]|nr:cytochrome P450 [Xylogone sp. PMI_703]
MDGLTPRQIYFASVSVGILSHLLYFIRGHRVMQTTRILTFHLVSSCVILIQCVSVWGAFHGTVLATSICSSYLLGLFSSMSVYRIFFHRLSRFPGPFAAKVTKFYGPYIARNMDMHIEHMKLLNQYGEIVRIGPSELMIMSLDAQQKIHGAQSRCSKRETFFEVIGYKGSPNLNSMGNREEHRWRRQVWDKAMNSQALENYELYAREVMHEWLDKLRSLNGQPIDTSLYSLSIPFENMGRMGFSKKFGSIKEGKETPMLHLIEVTFASLGKLGQMSWPLVLIGALGLAGDHMQFEKLACELADQREEEGDNTYEDIMKYFLQDIHAEKPKAFHNPNTLYADAQTIMIGGTDTIAAALSFAFYYIARDPVVQQKLRDELTPLFGRTTPEEFVNSDLREKGAPYLNAVINETMRMHNPTCNNGTRMTPPEGIEIDGVHIPGNVAVIVPIHAMHRNGKYFEHPDEFIPERWTSRQDLVIERQAYHPFLIGPYNCVGKRLGLLVLRLVLAYTVWNYDFEFAPGEDGTAIHRDAANQLILKAGKLECVFHPRQETSLLC